MSNVLGRTYLITMHEHDHDGQPHEISCLFLLFLLNLKLIPQVNDAMVYIDMPIQESYLHCTFIVSHHLPCCPLLVPV